jgi:hypothetical protein
MSDVAWERVRRAVVKRDVEEVIAALAVVYVSASPWQLAGMAQRLVDGVAIGSERPAPVVDSRPGPRGTRRSRRRVTTGVGA